MPDGLASLLIDLGAACTLNGGVPGWACKYGLQRFTTSLAVTVHRMYSWSPDGLGAPTHPMLTMSVVSG